MKLLHFSSFLVSDGDNDFLDMACRLQHTTILMHRWGSNLSLKKPRILVPAQHVCKISTDKIKKKKKFCMTCKAYVKNSAS